MLMGWHLLLFSRQSGVCPYLSGIYFDTQRLTVAKETKQEQALEDQLAQLTQQVLVAALQQPIGVAHGTSIRTRRSSLYACRRATWTPGSRTTSGVWTPKHFWMGSGARLKVMRKLEAWLKVSAMHNDLLATMASKWGGVRVGDNNNILKRAIHWRCVLQTALREASVTGQAWWWRVLSSRGQRRKGHHCICYRLCSFFQYSRLFSWWFFSILQIGQ